jgi:hypothetical protein
MHVKEPNLCPVFSLHSAEVIRLKLNLNKSQKKNLNKKMLHICLSLPTVKLKNVF